MTSVRSDKEIGDAISNLMDDVLYVEVSRLPVMTAITVVFSNEVGVTYSDLKRIADYFGDRFVVETDFQIDSSGGYQTVLVLRYLGEL